MRPGIPVRLAAELVGTFFLVFFGAAAGAVASAAVDGDAVQVALAHAFTLAVVVWAFGAVSGAHVNPAVTVALAARRLLSWADAGLYIVAQLVGGVLAGLLVWATTGETGVGAGLGTTHVSPGFTVGGALIAEIIGTFLLVSAVYLLAVSERVPAAFAALGIGLALGAAILALGPVSGASLNPARTLGPELALSLAGGDAAWSNAWLYLVGPLVGGLLAVFVHGGLSRLRTPTTT
ncbi:MAG TPA: aquaporin [Micromonosporaceae bacterium]|nr:aquaporin [Micromonosporaceae bacterium]